MALVIDVRTAGEFASGHLQGSVNISVESPDFEVQIGSLDKHDDYIAYCRSGYRSGVAIGIMSAVGFTGQLTNAGGIEEASDSLGLPIII